MKQCLRFFGVMALCLCLTGCHRPVQEPPAARVVTDIAVTFQNGPLTAQRHYTASPKVRTILHYLRWIDPYGQPEVDPDTVTGNSIRIELYYSDGNKKTYLQKADRYLWEEGKSWQNINPEYALDLSRILGQMESDG